MRRTAEEAAATRRALLVAAIAEIAERGYATSTLAGIAARAGVTRGAAYHHFPDKAALYLSAINELWAEAATPVWATLDGDDSPQERLRAFLVTFFTALEHDAMLREVFALTMRSADGAPELAQGLADKQVVMAQWRDQLAAMLAEAPLRPGVSAGAAAIAVIASVNGTAATWLATPELFSPAELAEELAAAVLHGVCP